MVENKTIEVVTIIIIVIFFVFLSVTSMHNFTESIKQRQVNTSAIVYDKTYSLYPEESYEIMFKDNTGNVYTTGKFHNTTLYASLEKGQKCTISSNGMFTGINYINNTCIYS